MIEWLLAPMDAVSAHDVSGPLSWHARAMVLAWGILVPIGIITARYFKILPFQDWPRELDSHGWWNTHRVCQYGAFGMMLIGFWIILWSPPVQTKPGPHAFLGWTVLALGLVQVAGGILRGTNGGPTDAARDGTTNGDHFDMTPRRLLFVYVHKTICYLALGLAIVTILFGLWQANAPNWMWLTLILWWGALALASIALQWRGRAIDTYQAIWGPDPSLPGNRCKPIGFGIARHTND